LKQCATETIGTSPYLYGCPKQLNFMLPKNYNTLLMALKMAYSPSLALTDSIAVNDQSFFIGRCRWLKMMGMLVKSVELMRSAPGTILSQLYFLVKVA